MSHYTNKWTLSDKYISFIHLQVMETSDDATHGYECLQLCKYQAKPRVIYTSSQSEDSFLAVLRSSVFDEGKLHDEPSSDSAAGRDEDEDDQEGLAGF